MLVILLSSLRHVTFFRTILASTLRTIKLKFGILLENKLIAKFCFTLTNICSCGYVVLSMQSS